MYTINITGTDNINIVINVTRSADVPLRAMNEAKVVSVPLSNAGLYKICIKQIGDNFTAAVMSLNSDDQVCSRAFNNGMRNVNHRNSSQMQYGLWAEN